jgi:hypothetical protein
VIDSTETLCIFSKLKGRSSREETKGSKASTQFISENLDDNESLIDHSRINDSSMISFKCLKTHRLDFNEEMDV